MNVLSCPLVWGKPSQVRQAESQESLPGQPSLLPSHSPGKKWECHFQPLSLPTVGMVEKEETS